jgi:hypothetical protein
MKTLIGYRGEKINLTKHEGVEYEARYFNCAKRECFEPSTDTGRAICWFWLTGGCRRMNKKHLK